MNKIIGNKITLIFLVIIAVTSLNLNLKADERSPWTGAFSRMGFGTRGMAMGNSVNAVIHGAMGSYYNPAAVAFTRVPTLDASMGLMSLDRSLNFFHFTTKVPPAAGVSLSVINAGVSDIERRNRDGMRIESISTSENMFNFAFGIRFDERISAGVAFKLFYYNLYDKMTSTSVGFDLGIIYLVNRQMTLSVNIRDIASKYKWDSTKLYGQDGRRIVDKFPLLYQIGGAYLTDDETLLISVQAEYSDAFNFIFRAGVEAYLTENVVLRGGIDNIFETDLNKPSLGIGFIYPLGDWVPSFNYTLVFEPFAPSSLHLISLGIEF